MKISDFDILRPSKPPSELSILIMKAGFIGAILLLQISAIYYAPDEIQKSSGTDFQRAAQSSLLSNQVQHHGSYKPWIHTSGIIPASISAITDKALKGTLDVISLFTTGAINRNVPTDETSTWPSGMQMAVTLYRVTTWKTWFLASALVAWGCDHDFGSKLLVFTTVTHVAQSLMRNIVGSPPSYWLFPTAAQQLCHCEGYSLPPENLTICAAFFLFLNYLLHKRQKIAKKIADSPAEKEQLQLIKSRLIFIRIVSIAIPSLLFGFTTFYGTHTLIDNFIGVTFALFAFSVYRVWEFYSETKKLEEMDSIVNEEPSVFFTYWKSFMMPAIVLGMVYGVEKLSRTWDINALNEYPEVWKTNVEYNCNVKDGAATIIMSMRTFGFGFANFANTATLFGLMIGVALRDAAHIADTSNRHNVWKTIFRIALGLTFSALFSHVLRWYLLEEPNPYRSYIEKYSTAHPLTEVEQVESVILHLDLAFKPIWILALSPLFFDYLGLGSYLLDDSEYGEEVPAEDNVDSTVEETTETTEQVRKVPTRKGLPDQRRTRISQHVVVRETIRVRHDRRR